MTDSYHLRFWSAQLWPRLFPIICQGTIYDVMDVFRFLRTLPQDDRIVSLLNEQCINKFKQYGIDHNFVY